MMKTDQSYDNSNDRLEEFFQNRLEKSDLQFNEGNWKKMEAMLDEAKPAAPWFRRVKLFWVWAGLILLLLVNGVMLYVNTTAYLSPDESARQIQSELPKSNPNGLEQKPKNNTITKEKKKLDPKLSKNNQEKEVEDTQNSAILEGQNSDIPKTMERRKSLQPNAKISTIERRQSKTAPKHGQGKTENNAKVIAENDGDKIDTSSSGKNENIDPEENNIKKTTQKEIDQKDLSQPDNRQIFIIEPLEKIPFQLSEVNLSNQYSPALSYRAPVFSAVDDEANKKENQLSKYRWALGVSYSTDISTTGLNDFTRPGSRWGATIEYMLNPKFSLQAGMQFAKVHYEASGEEYNAPYGYWMNRTDGIVPETIDATCNIIDFSLQAKYYFVNQQRSRLFLSGGMSSYFLTREFYAYNFAEPPTNPDVRTYNELRNESRNLLGIANLSIGYELAIHPRMSFQIEPFLKLPLGDVGFGGVNLFSSGVNFHLRYHLGKK